MFALLPPSVELKLMDTTDDDAVETSLIGDWNKTVPFAFDDGACSLVIRFLIEEFFKADLSNVAFLRGTVTGVLCTLKGVRLGEFGVLVRFIMGVPVRSTKCIDLLGFADSLRTVFGDSKARERVVAFWGVNEVINVPDKFNELNFSRFSFFGGVSGDLASSFGM